MSGERLEKLKKAMVKGDLNNPKTGKALEPKEIVKLAGANWALSFERFEALKKALKKGLDIDLTDPKTGKDLEPNQIAKLAELYCSLSFKPAEFYRKANHVVESQKNDNAPLTQEKLVEAVKLSNQGDAELDADQAQLEVGRLLAEACEHGDDVLELPRDQSKARRYGRVERSNNLNYLKAARTGQKKKWTTARIYLILGWFTSFRLFFVRSNRIANYFQDGFLVNRVIDVGNEFGNVVINSITQNLDKIAWWASLSYAVELIFDIGVMLRTAFWPTREEKENNPSAWSRVVNTFKKDDRIPRMVNASVWFAINCACWFVAPPLAAILNLALFTFDFGPDIYKYYRDKWKHDNLLIRIKTRINELKAEIPLVKKLAPDEVLSLQQKIASLQQVQARLEVEKQNVMAVRKRALFVTGLILVGMAILLIPQFASVTTLIAVAATTFFAVATVLGVRQAMTKKYGPILSKSAGETQDSMSPRKRAFLIFCLILAGIAVVTVPHLVAATAVTALVVQVVAASIAMLGSLIGGLGNRIRLEIKKKPSKPEISDQEYQSILSSKVNYRESPVGEKSPDSIAIPEPLFRSRREVETPAALASTTRVALITRFNELNPRPSIQPPIVQEPRSEGGAARLRQLFFCCSKKPAISQVEVLPSSYLGKHA